MHINIKPQTSTRIKICGITQISQAKDIAKLKVDAIGVIGVPNSPRFVSEEKRLRIFEEVEKVSNKIERVLVVADIDNEQLEKIINNKTFPSVIQLHGQESKHRCKEIKKIYPTIKIWKAIRIKSERDLSNAENYQENVDALLLDAWDPHQIGGTGKNLPIEWLQKINFNIPCWVAGGMSAEWIPKLFSHLTPFGIDASSRLEVSPGIKDLNKVNALINTIRSY